MASEAIDSLELEKKDPRLTLLMRVEGHLFDSALLNRLLDMAVDSPCDFEVCACQACRTQPVTCLPALIWHGEFTCRSRS